MKSVYILVEDRRRIIVISDSPSLCEYFRDSLKNIHGNDRLLEVLSVDKEYINFGSCINFEMWYRYNP